MQEKANVGNNTVSRKTIPISKYSKLIKKLDIKRRKLRKSIIKKAIIKKAIIISSVIGLGFGIYFGAKKTINDLNGKTYYVNSNVEPGYYNENPVKIGISDEFNDASKQQIAEAIEYLDEKAEGLRFEYFYGSPTRKNCDIVIKPAELEGKILGQAKTESLTNIKGTIFIEERQDKNYNASAVALHEICHLIGLEHHYNYSSIMFPRTGYSFKALSSQDIENINTIYPPEEMEN